MAAMICALLGGCATIAHVSIPEQQAATAEIPGFTGVRLDAEASADTVRDRIGPVLAKLRARMRERQRSSAQRLNFLAISGGAQDGAFGAGLLIGWSERGTIPEFDLVTGVSAGALIAPFAFAGPEFGRELEKVFTKPLPEAGDGGEAFASFLAGGAVPNTAVVKRLIARHIDDRLLDVIAAERARGRLLLIGTTNIETQRSVYWDMGKIAQSTRADRGKLFRKILLASTAIPGAIDPVVFPVISNGKTYDEVHVDGGATRGVFLAPLTLSSRSTDPTIKGSVVRKLYVIRNGKVAPEHQKVSGTTFGILGRTIATLVKYRGNGDLYRLYARSLRDNIDFNLAHIPASYRPNTKNEFNIDYLRELFEFGRKWGAIGYPWAKFPPGFDPRKRDVLTRRPIR